ncbi:Acyl-CoA dehydrogenase, short-chain specific [Minicystis rosea]|nr:Acyl-CoA dehydrogenase, short-chain specific [Minicystis rosea]
MSVTPLAERFAIVGASCFAAVEGDRDAVPPFSRERFRALGATGLFRLAIEGHGLAGATLALAGFAEGSFDLGLATSALAQMVAVVILARHASGPVADRWLARLASGEAIATIANAEPGAGTNILGLRARARAVPDGGFLLSARKRCITNAPAADVAIVSARVAGADPRRAITCFAVELPAPRVYSRPRLDLAGLTSSPTGDLLLFRAEVPHAAAVGDIGSGVALFREVFALERLFAGALFLATLRRCQRRALDIAEARDAFRDPIGVHQHVQERVLQMRVAADLLDGHLRETARRMDAGEDVGPALAAIKIHGLDAAHDALTGLRRLLGARGLSRADWTARVSEDLAVLAVFGGTVELHKRALYADLVREREARVDITIAAPPPAGSALERDLVALVARAMPAFDHLHGRYTYDAPATHLALAHAGAKLAGFRAMFSREVRVGDARVRALGMGIAVDPAFQRRGLGRRLTAAALAWARASGHRLGIAFLATTNAEPLLRENGFRPLRARVTYHDAQGNRREEEEAPCWVAALDGSAVVLEIEAHGELDLGDRTF